MSDRLEEIKKKPFQRPLQVITDGDILWLIAEVERLRSDLVICDEVDDETQIVLNHYEKLIAEVESLTEAKDDNFKEVMALQSANEKLETENAELKISFDAVAYEELKTVIESISKERDELKEKLPVIFKARHDYFEAYTASKSEVESLTKERDDFQATAECSSQINQELEDEIKSVVTEINSIKAERNAVIKAHADLLSECQELKTQLKFLEARLGE